MDHIDPVFMIQFNNAAVFRYKDLEYDRLRRLVMASQSGTGAGL
jgi:hypothetical protein